MTIEHVSILISITAFILAIYAVWRNRRRVFLDDPKADYYVRISDETRDAITDAENERVKRAAYERH